LPADRRRRLRRIVISLVTALSLIGVSVTAASVGAAGSSAVARPRAPDNSLPAASPSGDARESLDFVRHTTLVPAPMPTPAPVVDLTASIIPIAPVVPGGPASPGGAGSVAGGFAAADPRAGGDFILISRSRLLSLPTSGPAWGQLKAVADSNASSPDLSNMDQDNNVQVLAKALVYARTGDSKYRADVIANLKAAIGTEGGSALALAREAAAYALAADFIGLAQADPQFDSGTFRPWLRSLLTKSVEGRSLVSTHEDRANNWGTHAGASRAAIAAYLGDGAELARTAQVFRGWVGERSAYAGFSFGDLSWQPNPSAPVAVLPAGARLGGQDIGGALPEEMRRGGEFQWPPAGTDYPWGALEGAVLQAEILNRYGYDAYNWGNAALLRAVQFLFGTAGWRPAGNDQWVFWVIDYRYGTGYRVNPPISPGKNFAWSDWLYSR
jgi:hypothetical protein